MQVDSLSAELSGKLKRSFKERLFWHLLNMIWMILFNENLQWGRENRLNHTVRTKGIY